MEIKHYEFLPSRDKRIIVKASPVKANEMCYLPEGAQGRQPLSYKLDGYKVEFTSIYPGEQPFHTWIEKKHFELNYRELADCPPVL